MNGQTSITAIVESQVQSLNRINQLQGKLIQQQLDLATKLLRVATYQKVGEIGVGENTDVYG